MARAWSKKGVRLAQKMRVGPGIPVIIQLERAEVGPTSGPIWRLSHLVEQLFADEQVLRRTHSVRYTHLRAHETRHDLVCRLLLV